MLHLCSAQKGNVLVGSPLAARQELAFTMDTGILPNPLPTAGVCQALSFAGKALVNWLGTTEKYFSIKLLLLKQNQEY